MNFLSKISSSLPRPKIPGLSKLSELRRQYPRIGAKLRVRVGEREGHHWTEDVSLTGMRMKIAQRFSLGDLAEGDHEVPLLIEAPDGEPVKVFGKPIWSARSDDGQLSTGWVLSCHEGDSEERLQDLLSSFE